MVKNEEDPFIIPPIRNQNQVSQFYNTYDSPEFFEILGNLLNNGIKEGYCFSKDSKNIIDFRKFDPKKQIFTNPLDEAFDKISNLHFNIINQVLSGPQGYNGGAGPMSLQRASEILTTLGGDYSYSIFGQPIQKNLYDTVLAPPPTDSSLEKYLILDPVTNTTLPMNNIQIIPPNMSLYAYSNNIFANMPYYLGLSKNIMHILQSARGRVNLSLLSAITGMLGNLNNPCFPLNVLLAPILAGLQLLLRLIDMLLNLLSNLLSFIMQLIEEILGRIFDLIVDAILALIHMLGLDETSGLLSLLLSLINDPCIRFLLSTFGGGIINRNLYRIIVATRGIPGL